MKDLKEAYIADASRRNRCRNAERHTIEGHLETNAVRYTEEEARMYQQMEMYRQKQAVYKERVACYEKAKAHAREHGFRISGVAPPYVCDYDHPSPLLRHRDELAVRLQKLSE